MEPELPILPDRRINILIVDDNNSPFILPLVRCFYEQKNIHLDVIIFTDEKPHLFKYSRYIRHVYRKGPLLEKSFEKDLREIISKAEAHAIFPSNERISLLFSHHQDWLKELVAVHPVANLEVLETIRDKWKLNQWLMANQFPFTLERKCTGDMKRSTEGSPLPFPMLLKPRMGAGGKGIKLVQNHEDLKKWLPMVEKDVNGYILQELIEGYDIDMSLFAMDGVIHCYTIQKGIIGRSYAFPKGIQFLKNMELFTLVSDIVRKLSYSGIAHLDFRYDTEKEQYFLVDFNARYWSSLSGSRIMGVNFPLRALAHTLDIALQCPDYQDGYFYYGTTAISRMVKNLFSRTKYPVRLRNSQIPSILRDPLPEILFLLKRPFQSNS